MPSKKTMKSFFAQEAKEPAHKSIKNALLASGETPMKKKNHKGKIAKIMKKFASGKLHAGSKKGPKVTKKSQALAIGYSEQRKAKKKK